MKRILLASVGMLVLVSSATAADLPYRGPPVVTRAPIYNPYYNWTGFYLGINGGGGWGGSNWDGIGNFGVSGGLIGVTGGYNYQFNQFVLGGEADIDWSGMRGSTAITTICFNVCETWNSWLGTARIRLGYAFDRFMPFLTGGLAVGNIGASAPFLPGGSITNAGWTIGGGFEVALIGSVTAKAEYLYVGLGDFNCGLNCGLLPSGNVSFHANVLRGGINFRF